MTSNNLSTTNNLSRHHSRMSQQTAKCAETFKIFTKTSKPRRSYSKSLETPPSLLPDPDRHVSLLTYLNYTQIIKIRAPEEGSHPVSSQHWYEAPFGVTNHPQPVGTETRHVRQSARPLNSIINAMRTKHPSSKQWNSLGALVKKCIKAFRLQIHWNSFGRRYSLIHSVVP